MRLSLAPLALLLSAGLVLSVPAVASAATQTATDATAFTVDAAERPVPFAISSGAFVGEVTLTIDMQQLEHDGSGGFAPGAFPYDAELVLQSPEGTSVTLLRGEGVPGGYPRIEVGLAPSPRVVVTFDDDAAATIGTTGSGVPESGTFRPAESLSAFEGEPAGGTWTLIVRDTFTSSPLQHLSSTLTVVDAAPTLAGGALAGGIVGDDYEADLPAVDGGDATYALDEGSTLPAGLALAADGSITGVPTVAGSNSFDVIATTESGTSDPATFTIVVQRRASIDGAASTTARIGEPFAYAPTVDLGDPAGTVSASTPLPAWLTLDAATGALSGTPTGALGDVVVTLVADNGIAPSDSQTVTIAVEAGAVAEIVLTPEDAVVPAGSTVAFAVAGVDVEGNAAEVDAADVVLTSDVATDEVDGLSVTFPTASQHVVTATHVPSEATDAVTVEVVAAAPSPSAPAPSAPAASAPAPSTPANAGTSGGLPVTGGDALGGLGVLAALVLVAAGVGLRLRRA